MRKGEEPYRKGLLPRTCPLRRAPVVSERMQAAGQEAVDYMPTDCHLMEGWVEVRPAPDRVATAGTLVLIGDEDPSIAHGLRHDSCCCTGEG